MARTDGEAAVALLRDSFGRVADQVTSLTTGLSADVATYRPDERANSIAWLLWHLTRIQDDHVAAAAGTDQVWDHGWRERFGLPFEAHATGYGQSAEEVGQVRVAGELLARYHADVHRATLAYLDRLDPAELARIVDEQWDPPVTVGVRLVSVIGDTVAHLGQAAYVRGLAER